MDRKEITEELAQLSWEVNHLNCEKAIRGSKLEKELESAYKLMEEATTILEG